MPITGPKPKPPDQKRNRNAPRQEWVEVVDVPYVGGPQLPRLRRPRPATKPYDPPRPLGAAGRQLWDELVGDVLNESDGQRLLTLCEMQDERAVLRFRVLAENDASDRAALRHLDNQYLTALISWCEKHTTKALDVWPEQTRRWWSAVRRLPHALLWKEADWRYAIDTAFVHAAFHRGDNKVLSELRNRERVIGTTSDSRRDLRIRYVDPNPDSEATDATVTAMADYRKILEEE